MEDQKWIDGRKWFHGIDFGGGVASRGRFGRDVPPNYTLYGTFEYLRQMKLENARCLDVGTMDGLASFVMKGMGAREVVACDMAERETFLFARKRLGLDIEYKTPVPAVELPVIFENQPADLVVMAGVLYHVYDPMNVLVAVREVLRPGGYLILETTHDFRAGGPTMSFNPVDDSAFGLNMPNVYWRPSKRALVGMLQLAGFSVVSTIAVNARLTVLARAARPKDIENRPERIATAQDRDLSIHYKECADFDTMQNDTTADASIDYHGPRGDSFLYRAKYDAEIPYQPAWKPSRQSARTMDTGLSLALHASTRLVKLNADLRARVGLAAASLLPSKVRQVLVAARVGGAGLRRKQRNCPGGTSPARRWSW